MASAKQTVQSNASTNVKTSIFEKISYGMGDVACNVVFALTSGLITYFYTNVMSVSAAMVGMIMLISRILTVFPMWRSASSWTRCIPSTDEAERGCSGWHFRTAFPP